MITSLELALATFIAAKLAAITPTLPAHVTRAATNKEKPPGDRSMIVVRCEEALHSGGGLHLVNVQILVISPADVAGVTVETHSKLENAINAVMNTNADQAGFNAAVATVSGHAGGNYFADGWRAGVEGTNWQPYYSITAGIKDA